MEELFQDWQSKIVDNLVWGAITGLLIAVVADGVRLLLRTFGLASGRIPTFFASVLKAFSPGKATAAIAFEPFAIVLRIAYALLLTLSIVAAGAVVVCGVAFLLVVVFLPGGPAALSPEFKELLHLSPAGFPTERSVVVLSVAVTILSTLLLAIPGMAGFIVGLGRVISGLAFFASWLAAVWLLFQGSVRGALFVQDQLSGGGVQIRDAAKIGGYIVCALAAFPILSVLKTQYDWSLRTLGFRIDPESAA